MTKPKQATIDFQANEFVAISRQEILAVNILPVDVFIKISDDKLLLIGRKGSKSLEDLHLLESDLITEFYVRKNEFKDCVGQNLMIAGIIVQKPEVSDKVKIEFLNRTAVSVFKEIEGVGFNHEAFEHAKAVTQSIQTLVGAKPDLMAVITTLANVSDDLLRHSMAVSAVAVVIARSMGWTVQSTQEKIALGGLLHDIGMKELPKEIINRPRYELTAEEQQNYETHVQRGVEILSTMPSVPEDIIAMAAEHHENAIGQGYPRRIRDFKMNPLAKVVALADLFCELTLKNVNYPNPKTAQEAVAYIEGTLGQPFSKPAFFALRTALTKIPSIRPGSKIAS